ncbi:MAG: endonuclease/exonuclease/phosphatase family protein [Paracoccaceae bacterium]
MRIPLAAVLIAAAALPAQAETTLRIMSFNIWGGGGNEAKGIEETVAVLRAANPDIVAIQETRLEGEDCTADNCPPLGTSVAGGIAAALGYHYYDQTQENVALWSNAVLSRYPIGPATAHDLGVPIDVNGVTVWAFNVHLDDSPYQPYQLLGIEYGDAPFIKTEAEAVDWAMRTRGPAMDLLFQDMKAADGAAAVFVFGDFNEPSALDWTPEAAAGQQPVAVRWPTTARLLDAGFTDTYRAVHPDPVAMPAFTWTPRYDETATDDHPDRIDFAFARGAGLTVTGAWIVGETGKRTDLAVDPWPSDHRATLAEVRF